MSGEMFAWLFHGTRGAGPVRPRGVANPSNLLQFNQTGYIPEGWNTTTSLIDPVGWVYAPKQCRGSGGSGRGGSAAATSVNDQISSISGCTMHVHYHPCGGSWRALSTAYMLESGLAAYVYVNVHPRQSIQNSNSSACAVAVGSKFGSLQIATCTRITLSLC